MCAPRTSLAEHPERVVPQRVLLVDDEPAILTTFQQILAGEGFDVSVAATVAEGLAQIQAKSFDALITDLNIGEPGDGFTLVSAMRRTQPDAVTFIITGFPAFDTALEAIRSQVDDYFVKPMDIHGLLQALHRRLDAPRRHVPIPAKRVGAIVQRKVNEVVQHWLRLFRDNCVGDKHLPDAGRCASLSDDELIDNVPDIIDEIARCAVHGDRNLSEHARRSATHHGEQRFRQGFSIDVFLRESRFLRQAILSCIHSSMLEVNLSYVFEDLGVMSDSLDAQLEISLAAYVSLRDQKH